jgi:hypothetical protein
MVTKSNPDALRPVVEGWLREALEKLEMAKRNCGIGADVRLAKARHEIAAAIQSIEQTRAMLSR